MPLHSQLEYQAEVNLKASLSKFQFADYERRKNYCIAMGQSYSLVDFQSDINRFSNSDDGWVKSWWKEKIDSSFGQNAVILMEYLPDWFYVDSPKVIKTYPISIRLPEPKNVLLESYIANLELLRKNVISLHVGNKEIQVHSYEQLEPLAVERGLLAGEVTALKIEYWNQFGYDDWLSDVMKHLSIFNVPEHQIDYSLLKEVFGSRDSVDAAEDLAKRLGYVQPYFSHSASENQYVLAEVNTIQSSTIQHLMNRRHGRPTKSPWYSEPAPHAASSIRPDDDF